MEITRRIRRNFQNLADRTWENSSETNALKRKKFCDNLLKGFESNLVYEKLRNWNQWNANDVTVVHQNGFFTY
jgi:hypothetical protein